MQIKSNADTTIEDHIIQCGQIPLSCNWNRDKTAIIGEFTMIVGSTCPEVHRVEGSEIEVYTTGTTYPQFIGEIIRSDFTKDTESYSLLVRDNLYKLTEKMITKANLETLIQAGTGIEYWNEEELVPHPSVQALFLIKEMFADVGLSFNYVATYKDQPIVTIDGNIVQIEHLRLDENMLWHINAPVAVGTIADIKYDKHRISYWDFISFFLTLVFAFDHSYLFLSQFSTAKEYRIDVSASPNTISDNNVYSFTDGKITGNNKGWNTTHKFDDDRNHYAGFDPFPTPLIGEAELNREEYFRSGDGGNSVSIFNSLVFLYHKHWDTGNQTIWGSTDDNGAYAAGQCMNGSSMVISFQEAKNRDWNITRRRRINALRVDDQKICNLDVATQSLLTIKETIV